MTTLRRTGLASWYLLGIVALAAVAALTLGAISSVLVPVLIAIILGPVLQPLTDALARAGLPKALAVVVTLLVVAAVTIGLTAMTIWGFWKQWPHIHRELLAGWQSFVDWARDHDLAASWLDCMRAAFEDHSSQLGQGVLGAIVHTFYGAVSLSIGVFIGGFVLFFILRDSDRLPAWLARVTTIAPTQADAVVAATIESLRGYFKGTAITALVTAPIFMVPLLVMRVPLAIPIFVVYFFLSFVPYAGAWITGVFAILIALGTQGPWAALILGVTFMISNGAIQSVVNSWALGSALSLHPVAVLLATMIGGVVAGILGMILAAPVVAIVVKSVAALRDLRIADEQPAPGT